MSTKHDRKIVHCIARMISHYIIRQQIVVELLLEYGTGLMKHYGVDIILDIDIEKQRIFWEQNYLGNIPQIGIWRDEWEYFMHGRGCRLTHKTTKEPFEWDAGHPKSFYLGSFYTHAQWRTLHDPQHDDILLYKSKIVDIKETFNLMENIDMLVRDPLHGTYFLVI